jgi:hypothetical protein
LPGPPHIHAMMSQNRRSMVPYVGSAEPPISLNTSFFISDQCVDQIWELIDGDNRVFLSILSL